MKGVLDLKGLSSQEREERVFSVLENLKVGEVVDFIFDFNPLPLTYLLKAREEFEVSFKKEGPPEWILTIERTKPKKAYDREFKELLRKMREANASAEITERLKEVFQALDAKTLGLLEQELIQEGISREEIRKNLCDIHLEVLRDTLIKKRIVVSSPHPVHTFMEEHKMILNFLNELSQIVQSLEEKKSFEEMPSEELEKLEDIVHHLVEAESHHQREEDALFPKLKNHGIAEPVEIMKMDHTEFRERKKKLYEYIHNAKDYSFDEFKKNVIELGSYLSYELESHIFKEDNILYQIALQTLTPKEWEEVKKECDRIGYCCFTPQG